MDKDPAPVVEVAEDSGEAVEMEIKVDEGFEEPVGRPHKKQWVMAGVGILLCVIAVGIVAWYVRVLWWPVGNFESHQQAVAAINTPTPTMPVEYSRHVQTATATPVPPTPTNMPRYRFAVNDPIIEKLKQYGHWVSVRTEQEIRDWVAGKDGFCSTTCAELADNKELFEKQFAIMNEISNAENCVFSDDLIYRIHKELLLFSGSFEVKQKTESLFHDGFNVCGVRYLAHDGLDVSIINFEYQAAFFVQDTFITFQAPVYIPGVSEEMDAFLIDMGYEIDEDSFGCSSNICFENDLSLYDDGVSFSQPFIPAIVAKYDAIVQSLELL